MDQVLWLSMATAFIAFTTAETAVFRPVRTRVAETSHWLGKLLACGYCTGFWAAFVLTLIYRPRLLEGPGWLDPFLTAFVIAWLAAFQWALLCRLLGSLGK